MPWKKQSVVVVLCFFAQKSKSALQRPAATWRSLRCPAIALSDARPTPTPSRPRPSPGLRYTVLHNAAPCKGPLALLLWIHTWSARIYECSAKGANSAQH